MRIGEAAELLGVQAHVLRHWEDEGVITPPRTTNGYRDYDPETLTRVRIALGCRDAGLSLEQTRLTVRRDAPGRDVIIRSHLHKIERHIEQLHHTRRFLEHVLGCRHSLMSRCPACSDYASATEGVG